jgi:hypothetical protein
MRKPIHINAARPTLEERAKRLRIPKARQKELQVLVDEFEAMLSNREEAPINSIEPGERRKSASAA